VTSKDEIVILDLHGKPPTPLGRRGSGPGEWRAIGALDLTAETSVVIYDPLLQRLTVLPRTESTQLQTLPVGLPQLFESARIAGGVLFLLSANTFTKGPVSISLTRVSDGKSIGQIRIDSGSGTVRAIDTDIRPIPPLFSPRVVWDASTVGSVILSRTTDAVLQWFTAQGLARSVRLALKPRPISRADVAAERRRLLPPSLPPAMATSVRPQVERAVQNTAKYHQVVRRIVASSHGSAWIATRSDGPSDAWILFDAGGNPNCRLELAPEAEIVWATIGQIVVLTYDAGGGTNLTTWKWRPSGGC
jgi:hypothetical protein